MYRIARGGSQCCFELARKRTPAIDPVLRVLTARSLNLHQETDRKALPTRYLQRRGVSTAACAGPPIGRGPHHGRQRVTTDAHPSPSPGSRGRDAGFEPRDQNSASLTPGASDREKAGCHRRRFRRGACSRRAPAILRSATLLGAPACHRHQQHLEAPTQRHASRVKLAVFKLGSVGRKKYIAKGFAPSLFSS